MNISNEIKLFYMRNNIHLDIVSIVESPSLISYHYKLCSDVKLKKITLLQQEINFLLNAKVKINFENYHAIFSVPKEKRDIIDIHDLLLEIDDNIDNHSDYHLPLLLGVDTNNSVIVNDLAKMPHLLVAGTTGSGKSVLINSMLINLIYRLTPHQFQLVLIDPKQVEFTRYKSFPHLLFPVLTENNKIINALKYCIEEMEQRYKLFSDNNVVDIIEFNNNSESLPFIVIVIDEFADLTLQIGKEFDDIIARLTQKARAAGIHLILATQRPSADIITGVIKSNVPARVALSCSSAVNSRVILDCNGAELLVGKGDMLYQSPSDNSLTRIQAPFVSTNYLLQFLQDEKAYYDDKLGVDNSFYDSTDCDTNNNNDNNNNTNNVCNADDTNNNDAESNDIHRNIDVTSSFTDNIKSLYNQDVSIINLSYCFKLPINTIYSIINS